MHGEQSGLVSIRAARPVKEIVEKLKQILRSKAITFFAVVDHSGEVAKAGMIMPNTKLLIFGNPKAGTPLMLAGSEHRHRSAAEDPRS